MVEREGRGKESCVNALPVLLTCSSVCLRFKRLACPFALAGILSDGRGAAERRGEWYYVPRSFFQATLMEHIQSIAILTAWSAAACHMSRSSRRAAAA